MSKIGRFEDLIAWQKSKALTKIIYEITRKPEFVRDFALASQIQRAAVSIMSNVAEGFERGGPAEFHRFLFMAKGSCAEVRSLLYVAYDIGYLQKQEFERGFSQADEVAKIIGGLRVVIEKRKK